MFNNTDEQHRPNHAVPTGPKMVFFFSIETRTCKQTKSFFKFWKNINSLLVLEYVPILVIVITG